VKKIAQNLAKPIFLAKLMHGFCRGKKGAEKVGLLLPLLNNRPK
jgi:hypothetical protein